MRKGFILTVLLFVVPVVLFGEATRPKKGDSREQVIRALGQPSGVMKLAGAKEIFLYEEGEVVLQNGVVVEVDITATSIAKAGKRRAEKAYEEAQREKGLILHEGKWVTLDELGRKNKRAKLLKNKSLRETYPEGKVITIPCSYAKTEPSKYVPPGFVPRQGQYSYKVHLPDGYHDSPSKKYPCIFIKARAGGGAVIELATAQKWIVVAVISEEPEHDLEGHIAAFLAAYDDVEKRFRVSPAYRFAVETDDWGIVTFYAALRPLSGVVLHEASFWNLGNRNYFYGCFKKNPKLRMCGIFGSMKFSEYPRRRHFIRIQEKASYYKIESYEGLRSKPPITSVRNAFDWLKKELRMP